MSRSIIPWGDPEWPGKLRRSWKCRSAWKSTCTPAPHASKTDEPAAASMANAVEAVVVSGMRARAPRFWTIAACTVALAPACVSAEDRFDTEHIFGFMIGTDVGSPGEREFQTQTTGRFGKGGGTYRALEHEFE